MGGNVTTGGSDAHWRRQAAIITGLALGVRLLWAFWLPIEPVSDGAMYWGLATGLAEGRGYVTGNGNPTAFWAVGPAFIYSLALRSGLPALPLIAFVQAFLGAASVAGLLLLARGWFDARTSLIAGGLLAVWPSQIQFTTALASELWFAAFLILAWLAWTRPDGPTWKRGVLTGVALAAATFIRPVALLILVPWALAEIVSRREWKDPVLAAVIAAACMLTLVSPWTYRNYQAFGRVVLVSTNGGSNLWMGNHPGSDGRYHPLPPDVWDLPEGERDETLRQRARDFIAEEPIAFVTRTLSKFVRLHDRETIGVVWNEPALEKRVGHNGVTGLKAFSTFYWWLAMGLGLVGTGYLFARQGWLLTLFHPLVLTWLYFAAIHAVIVIQDRYHFPSIPAIAMLGAFAISQLRPGREDPET